MRKFTRPLPPTKEGKIQLYGELNKHAEKGQIVFAGSSLMEMFPIEEFVEEDGLSAIVYNRGVGGYVTSELLEHVNTCITALAPSKVFINIGTNDLSNPQMTISEIMRRYGEILEIVKRSVPDVKLYLMAYYPVNYSAASEEMKACLRIRTNQRIKQANQQVAQLAECCGAEYIDVNAPLMDKDGNLKAEYTIEGMHINKDGYRAIYPLVRQYILKTA